MKKVFKVVLIAGFLLLGTFSVIEELSQEGSFLENVGCGEYQNIQNLGDETPTPDGGVGGGGGQGGVPG
ncbi:MAG: hypothetical protein HXS54_05720 [Theionarchaea archaeon]|nr:hypothetical protein [Theionarchaea archaeon]